MVADAKALDSPQPLPVALLGIPFDPLTIPDAIERIADSIAEGRPRYFVTANVDFLVQARRDAELRRILLGADRVLCDGMPLVWASRWFGNRLPDRAAGSDLVPELARRAAERGWRIFLLGGAPGVAAEAARRLEQLHPGLPPVESHAPDFQPLERMDHEAIVARIRAASPDLLLVAFGCPKQEKWIAAHYRAAGVPVTIGVGATVDFLAGRIGRAPQWMRRSGFEWGFRLAREPRRLFRRYAGDLVRFVPALVGQWRYVPTSRAADSGAPRLTATAYGLKVEAAGPLHRRALEAHWPRWREALEVRGHCLLDLGAVRVIDSTGLAFLSWWQKRLAEVRRNLVLSRPTPAVLRALDGMRLSEHFVVAGEPGRRAGP